MHYWNDSGGWGWGAWIGMAVMMVVFWGAIAWVVVTLIRGSGSHAPADAAAGAGTSSDALRILDERFARGEIDEDEYKRRRAALQAG